MSYSEERLYYACTNFCEAFFKLLCEKDKIKSKWCLDDGYKTLGKICEEKEEAIKILKEIIMELEEGVDEDEIRYELWRRKEIKKGKW